MTVPELAVRRPVTVLMAAVAVAVFGFLAARSLPVELLPSLAHPTLTVQTDYEDAAPITVEQLVTRPVEEAVGVIAGVRDLRSTSRAGLSEVVLEFEWGENMDFAALDVREKLGGVRLPREAAPPRVLRFDPSLEPVLRLALSGDRPPTELRELADRWLKPRLEAVAGVAAARVRGGLEPEIQVDADPDRLAALGLNLTDLQRALEAENVNRPGGTLKDGGSVYLVRTLHEFDDLEQLRRTVVLEGQAGRVRVEDVAEVKRGHRDRDELARLGGREIVEIALHREGDANVVAVAAAAREAVARLGSELGDDLTLSVLSDQSVYVSAAVRQVWSAALLGALLAVLVLYFFLRDPGPTAIVALTIPMSVIAVFLPLRQAGVSLNIMSLGGLALGVGMLVDNSIVVLEAIDRRRRQGLTRREAAVRGASEVASAVTAATLTTVAVFLPIVFVQGVAGQLFRDLAVTVCLSLVASLVVSLTVIPALSAIEARHALQYRRATLFPWDRGTAGAPDARPFTLRLGSLLVPPVGDGRHWFSKTLTVALLPLRLLLLLVVALLGLVGHGAAKVFDAVTWPATRVLRSVSLAYPGFVATALRHRALVLLVAVVLFAGSLVAAGRMGSDLVPDLAQGEFAFRLTLPEGTPLETTADVVARVEDALVADPRFDRVFSIVGSLPSTASGRRTSGENLAQLDFVLPAGARAEAEAEGVARVRHVLALFPQVDAELVRPSVLSVDPPVAVDVYAEDLTVLEAAAGVVAEALGRDPALTDVATTIEPGSPEVRVILDRDRASSLGVDAAQIGQALREQVRGAIVGQFREEEKRLGIRLRVKASARARAADIGSLRVRLGDGTAVPVSAVATIEVERGPAAIHRTSGSRVAHVTAAAPARDLGRMLESLGATVAGLALPVGATAELAGQDRELEVSLASLRLALALAIFLVYVVLAMQFESLRYPFVILLAVPMGVVGVVAALLLTGGSLGVLVLMGTVMLAGIVVNNAIVLVDAVRRRREEGERLDEALVGAGRERLRPILMTTATTVLGLLPMALGLGEGDELRRPLAVTVIGGLTAATLLTLVVVPCLYRLLSPREAGVEEAS